MGTSNSFFKSIFSKVFFTLSVNVLQAGFTASILTHFSNLSVFFNSNASFYEINKSDREISKILRYFEHWL